MISKIKKPGILSAILEKRRRQGKKIVFTNGCFDILHAGHIKVLTKAKSLGDILVVGLNSDLSIKAIKGKARPINNEKDRAEILAALSAVDFITIFDDETPERLIRMLRPDILVKGGDWSAANIVGADFVKAAGGRVVTVKLKEGYSTTSLIERARRISKNGNI